MLLMDFASVQSMSTNVDIRKCVVMEVVIVGITTLAPTNLLEVSVTHSRVCVNAQEMWMLVRMVKFASMDHVVSLLLDTSIQLFKVKI